MKATLLTLFALASGLLAMPVLADPVVEYHHDNHYHHDREYHEYARHHSDRDWDYYHRHHHHQPEISVQIGR